MKEIINNLLSIKQKLDEFESERRKTELYNSNRFNPFRFMRTDEIGLSKILAFLLDPRESHGQDNRFLNSFLEYIGKHNFLAYEKINVVTEQPTKENRRHDIFIEGLLNNKKCWIISIENKLNFARDQNAQLKDYRDDLERYKGAEYCLVYLPVFRQNPSEISISEKEWEKLVKDKNGILLSVNDLIDWLDNAPILAPAVKQFCNDFKKFLKEDVMGNTQSSNDLANYLVENAKELSSALAILDSKNAIYEKLLNKLVEQLNSKFDNTYLKLMEYGFKCYEHKPLNGKGGGIRFGNNALGVCLYFNKPDFLDAYYGIYSDKKSYDILHKGYIDLVKPNEFKYYESDKNTLPFWEWLGEGYKQREAEIFGKIPSGELADQIFELWKPLLDVIKKNLDKIKELDIK